MFVARCQHPTHETSRRRQRRGVAFCPGRPRLLLGGGRTRCAGGIPGRRAAPEVAMSTPETPDGSHVRSVHVGRPRTYTWLGRELVSSIFKDPVTVRSPCTPTTSRATSSPTARVMVVRTRPCTRTPARTRTGGSAELGTPRPGRDVRREPDHGRDRPHQRDHRSDLAGRDGRAPGHRATDAVLEARPAHEDPGFPRRAAKSRRPGVCCGC